MRYGLRDVRIGALGVELEDRPGGVAVVRSTQTVPAYPSTLSSRLHHWAQVAPDRTFLAEREAGGTWREISYARMRADVRAVAVGLLRRGLSADRPIAILSGNGIEHAVLALAAMEAGIPYAPVSPTYSLVAKDFSKLAGIVDRLEPGLIYAADASAFAPAIAAACRPDVEVVTSRGELPGRETTPFDALASTVTTVGVPAALAAAHSAVGPDTVAKVLFTSGSTGVPKGVITTHRMLCANQAMLHHWLAFVADEPPVLLDWLPWHHTFGGSHNFGLVLHNGGTLYIDEGRPTAEGIDATVRNLRDVAPTICFNVPKGFEELTVRLGRDAALADRFFSRLRLNFYAAASLPRHVARGLDEVAARTTGEHILMLTSLGATETAPAALACDAHTVGPGVVGVPLPGLELKLVPSGDKLEARLRGPTVTPGYWRDPEGTQAAFDDEGFYRLGDALRFAENRNPSRGFVFDGRLSEDFKLTTGTWVSVGALREALIGVLAPLARDVVIAGHGRGELTALVFPDLDACRALCAAAPRGDASALIAEEPVRSAFEAGLQRQGSANAGSSMRIERLLLLDEPPSLEAGELTDKGSINQRAVLARRAALVDELYAPAGSPRVISVRER